MPQSPMLDAVLNTYKFQLDYARKLVGDIAADAMCRQPPRAPNHPAWILGHLVAASDSLAEMLGLESTLEPTWAPLFGTQSALTTNANDYPTKAELLRALESQHVRVARELAKVDDTVLAAKVLDDGSSGESRTVGDTLVFMMVWHEANHLGQLTSWRRQMGLPRVLGV